MPGAGKSTVGVLLAKRTGRDFVDTDLLIQSAARRPLQEIVDADGRAELLRLEEACVLGLACERTVIATGGSVVYSTRAMEHLSGLGKVVFLDVPLPVLEQRIGDLGCRGLARRPGQTLADLYRERRPLYQRHAELTIDCGARPHEAVLGDLLQAID
jgi:shikimate kinase